MIKEILRQNNDMQSSININFDYKDKSKIDSYIVTSKSVEIINEVISTVNNENNHFAKLLTGPYGKGKSHLALYIIYLLSNSSRNRKEYLNLLKKSKELGEDVYKQIEEFISSDRKYLPVILNSTPYNKNFSDILVYSLRNALEINNINDIKLDFYFEKAIEKIESWEINYNNTFKLFEQELDEDIQKFKVKLSEYNEQAYKKFKQIYTNITAGENFNPYLDINPIKIYEETSDKLKEKGYEGIFVLYDEFSKYIEYIIAENSALDIKLLQDFAEFCTRSKEQQVHMLLISHKSIGQYTENVSKNNIDNWKAIEGRFYEIQYNDFSNQQYEIISSAIKKNEDKWNEFKLENKKRFDLLENDNTIKSLYKNMNEEDFREWIVYGAYPLHPVTTYCLPRISEKVAQNERTLFGFLCKDEKDTLIDYVRTNSKEVTLDALYNYFEDNIESLGYTDEATKILNKANRVIELLDNDIDKVIIKSLAVLHIVNNFTILKPDLKIINLIYGEEGEKSLLNLIKENHVVQRKVNGILDIATQKDIEILSDIKNIKENNRNLDINHFLNETFSKIFIESRRHNDKNNIIRYFKVKFEAENMDDKYIEQDLKNELSDGIVYIGNKDIEVDNLKNVIFIKNNLDKDIEELIRDLHAIKKLKLSPSLDKSIKSEVETLEAKYETKIRHYIDEILNLEHQNIVIHNNEELNEVKDKVELSRYISYIMDEIYYKTPIINNEMINKNEPSTVVKSSRKKIIDQILNNKTLVFRKGSLESTILRSTLLLNRVIKSLEVDGEYEFNYSILADNSENNLVKLIKDVNTLIIKSSKEEVNIFDIYQLMTNKEFGYGLKKGPIPIILATIFRKHKKYLSILEDGQALALNMETIEKIDLDPSKFTIKLEEATNEKDKYIERLEEIFKDYIDISSKNEDDLTYLVLGIKKWFLYLSKYAKVSKKKYLGNKEYEKLDKTIVKLKNKIRILNENSIEFLFKEIPAILDANNNYELAIDKLLNIKEEIDKLTDNLYINITQDIRNIFGLHEEASLYNGLSEWVDKFNKNKVYNNGFNRGFVSFIEDNKNLNDENLYLNKLSSYLIGLYLSDWNDETPCLFLDKIATVKQEIENESLNSDEYDDNTGKLEIALTVDIELSNRAEMMKNDLNEMFEDYGNSVTLDEKKQILLEILRDLK